MTTLYHNTAINCITDYGARIYKVTFYIVDVILKRPQMMKQVLVCAFKRPTTGDPSGEMSFVKETGDTQSYTGSRIITSKVNT